MGNAQSINQPVSRAYTTHPDCDALDHIPGEDGMPYFGRSLKTIYRYPELVNEHYQRWGEISRIKILHQRGVLVLGADNFQRIMLDRDSNFSAEMGYDQSIGQFYRGGLLITDFDEHKFKRRMLQTAFKNNAMKNYVALMNPIMQRHIQDWDVVDKFEFFPHIKETLLDVGAKVFIGVEFEDDIKKVNQAFLNINDGLMGQLRKEIPGTKYNRGKKGERFMRDFFLREVPKRRGSDKADMLTYMCNETQENGELFAAEDIAPQASFLLFGAHDTTASVLSHMVYYTAMHPEWQEKLREEAQAIGKKQLDYDDLDAMVLMDHVFKETLRLRPSVSMFTRRTIRECELGGHKIPADTMLFLAPIHNHFDSKHWQNPEQFDPMRFAPERQENKSHSFCYHPFGGGAHKCIGLHFASMLAKTFMHQFLLTYRYRLPFGFDTPSEWMPLPKPKSLPIQFERL